MPNAGTPHDDGSGLALSLTLGRIFVSPASPASPASCDCTFPLHNCTKALKVTISAVSSFLFSIVIVLLP